MNDVPACGPLGGLILLEDDVLPLIGSSMDCWVASLGDSRACDQSGHGEMFFQLQATLAPRLAETGFLSSHAKGSTVRHHTRQRPLPIGTSRGQRLALDGVH